MWSLFKKAILKTEGRDVLEADSMGLSDNEIWDQGKEASMKHHPVFSSRVLSP
jgi:hypothetical protein